MSEHGTFASGAISCETCRAAMFEALLSVPDVQPIPGILPFRRIFGVVDGMYSGEERDRFESDAITAIQKSFCAEHEGQVEFMVLPEDTSRSAVFEIRKDSFRVLELSEAQKFGLPKTPASKASCYSTTVGRLLDVRLGDEDGALRCFIRIPDNAGEEEVEKAGLILGDALRLHYLRRLFPGGEP